MKIANTVFDEAFALYNEDGFEKYEGWKKETETDTSTVHTRQMSYGKLFALRVSINVKIFLMNLRNSGNNSMGF